MSSLEPFFAPRVVAVLGASTDPSKWGNWVARGALEGAGARRVHLVNRRGGEIDGHDLLRSLAGIDDAELAVVVVPEPHLEASVDEALAAGARALVVITAGLGETGAAGRAREQALVARVRAAGARMLGPNCIGVFDGATRLRISSNHYPSGGVGLISQSGNLSLELGLLLERVGLGLSRFASVGNQADVTLPELIEHLAGHEPTEVIAIYSEDVADGRAFVAAASAATRRKPVVLLTSGSSAAGARGAASHTGALVSDDAVITAACAAAGVVRVESPGALIDTCHAITRAPLARGRRVFVLGDGGGHCAIAADLATAAGLEVPAFSDALVARLRTGLDVVGGLSNPVDLVGGGSDDFSDLSRMARDALAAGEADAVLLSGYFGGYAVYSDHYREAEPLEARRLAALQTELAAPIVVHSMFADDAGGATLREAGLATFARIEGAVGALRALVAAGEAAHAPGPPRDIRQEGPIGADPDYVDARALLAAAGIPFGAGAAATSADEAVAEADRLGLYPVTLKAVDPGLLHKSDRGGVRVGLPDAAALHAAATDMLALLAPRRLFVEATAEAAHGLELVIGVRRDARFGPVALAGLGGVLVELLRDRALSLAPVTEAEAERMLRSLRGAALLAGVRGGTAVDVTAAARALVVLSEVAAAHPEISEIEINPLLVSPRGCVALDARAVVEDA